MAVRRDSTGATQALLECDDAEVEEPSSWANLFNDPTPNRSRGQSANVPSPREQGAAKIMQRRREKERYEAMRQEKVLQEKSSASTSIEPREADITLRSPGWYRRAPRACTTRVGLAASCLRYSSMAAAHSSASAGV